MRIVPRKPQRRPLPLAAIAFICLLPFLMGGCPEFRNDAVDVFETAARGLLDAALDAYFDQFRSDTTF